MILYSLQGNYNSRGQLCCSLPTRVSGEYLLSRPKLLEVYTYVHFLSAMIVRWHQVEIWILSYTFKELKMGVTIHFWWQLVREEMVGHAPPLVSTLFMCFCLVINFDLCMYIHVWGGGGGPLYSPLDEPWLHIHQHFTVILTVVHSSGPSCMRHCVWICVLT